MQAAAVRETLRCRRALRGRRVRYSDSFSATREVSGSARLLLRLLDRLLRTKAAGCVLKTRPQTTDIRRESYLWVTGEAGLG